MFISAREPFLFHATLRRDRHGARSSAIKRMLEAMDRSIDDWQLEEIRAGIAEADAGEMVSHEEVSAWLKTGAKRKRPSRPDERSSAPGARFVERGRSRPKMSRNNRRLAAVSLSERDGSR